MTRPFLPALPITILSQNADAIRTALHTAMKKNSCLKAGPEVVIRQATDTPSQINCDAVEVMIADPDLAAQIIPDCTNLTWCQSTWAGNAPLLNGGKTDYTLTALRGVFGPLMREYVFAYLLQHARNLDGFAEQQAATPPRWESATRMPLRGQTLGIIGVGDIGKALMPVAQSFGMTVIGVSRSGNAVKGVERMYATAELHQFAQQADHVVNLMPDTPGTYGILNEDFFACLKPHSIFINAGRGNAVDDEGLLSSLDKHHLAHAVLDVFTQEPLPSSHPFWRHPKLTVTAHTAAESRPADVASVFLDNATRFAHGDTLLYQCDFAKGY